MPRAPQIHVQTHEPSAVTLQYQDSLPAQERAAAAIVSAKLECVAREHSKFRQRPWPPQSAECRSARERAGGLVAAATHKACDALPARIFRDSAPGTPISPAFPRAIPVTRRSVPDIRRACDAPSRELPGRSCAKSRPFPSANAVPAAICIWVQAGRTIPPQQIEQIPRVEYRNEISPQYFATSRAAPERAARPIPARRNTAPPNRTKFLRARPPMEPESYRAAHVPRGTEKLPPRCPELPLDLAAHEIFAFAPAHLCAEFTTPDRAIASRVSKELRDNGDRAPLAPEAPRSLRKKPPRCAINSAGSATHFESRSALDGAAARIDLRPPLPSASCFPSSERCQWAARTIAPRSIRAAAKFPNCHRPDPQPGAAPAVPAQHAPRDAP